MIDAHLRIRAGSGTKDVALADYLDPASEEAAHDAEYRWIKDLRQLPIDGMPFRDRFTARGDSLWWFTELYLHKQRVILEIHRSIAALDTLIEREGPSEISVLRGSPVVRHVTPALAAARGRRPGSKVSSIEWIGRLAGVEARARTLTLSALATRERWTHAPKPTVPPSIAAFVHRAFWRSGSADGSAESYIGAILAELERRAGATAISYVGVGPARNFRAHRRFRRGTTQPSNVVVPVERFANYRALTESRAVWHSRFSNFRSMTRAASLRQASTIRGIDCWPLVREQLAGIAWLQWPWSVRTMDEAAGALDVLRPRAVVTYAEAGGWGRALVLESRRRDIPSAGLQHGFIYRHWLNYRHEPDELLPTETPPFPHPTKTLLFDNYAAQHLRERGRLPAQSLSVTGSPRLDELATAIQGLTRDDVLGVRSRLQIDSSEQLVLVTTKEREARTSLPAFLDAASRVTGVIVAIKPHPAETRASYSSHVRNRPRVRVLAPEEPLAPLLAAAQVVVTVNSTVALDASALDIPAMAIGLPNNLSPFVDAGAMSGAAQGADVEALLRRILYDEGFRGQLAAGRRAVFGQPVITRELSAATRSADVLLGLVHDGRPGAARAG